MKKTPFRKGPMLSCLGLASLASCGIYSIISQSDTTLNNLPENETTKETETTVEVAQEATTDLTSNPTITVEVSATSEAQKSNPTYENDANYLKGVTYYSLASKYKDYLVLASRNSDIGKERAEKMAKLAESAPGKLLYTHWNGYKDANYLRQRPESVADGCRNAASYSEWTTGFTIPTGKTYWDLLWNICGKDGKDKPANWGYR